MMMLNLDAERFDTTHEDLCPALCWKGQFIEAKPDAAVPPSNDGLFWCMHTQTCIGPMASWPNRATARQSSGRVMGPESADEVSFL